MGLLDYFLCKPLQPTANMSEYDEKFIVAKLDAIKRRAKKFLLNINDNVDSAERNEANKKKANTL